MAVTACLSHRLLGPLNRLCAVGGPLSSRISTHHSHSFLKQSGENRQSTFHGGLDNFWCGKHQDNQRHIGPLFICGKSTQALLPVAHIGSTIFQIREYQNVLHPRLICEGCYFVWRHGRRHVECSDYPKHKQMKKVAPRKVWKEDYSIGKIVKAMDWHKEAPREFKRTGDKTSLSHNWLAGKLGHEL